MSIKSRLDKLEKFKDPDRPMIAVFQDYEDTAIYHIGCRWSGQVMTWPEIEKNYEDFVVLEVVYEDKNTGTD